MEINIKVLKTVTIDPCHIVQLEKWSYPTGEDNPPYEMWTIRDRMYSPITKKTIDIGLTKFYLEDQAYQRFDIYVDGYTTKSIAPLEDRTITSFKRDDKRIRMFIKNNRSYEIYNLSPVEIRNDHIIPTPEDVNFYVKIGDDIFTGKCHIENNERRWNSRNNYIYLYPKDDDSTTIDLYPRMVDYEIYPFFTNEYGVTEENLSEDILKACKKAIREYMENADKGSSNDNGNLLNTPTIHVSNVSDKGTVDFYFTINTSIYENFYGHYFNENNIVVYDSKDKRINVNEVCRNLMMGFSSGYFNKYYDVDDRDLKHEIMNTCERALNEKEKENKNGD